MNDVIVYIDEESSGREIFPLLVLVGGREKEEEGGKGGEGGRREGREGEGRRGEWGVGE